MDLNKMTPEQAKEIMKTLGNKKNKTVEDVNQIKMALNVLANFALKTPGGPR